MSDNAEVLHRIQTTQRGALLAMFRLNRLPETRNVEVGSNTQYPDVWHVTFLAPPDINLDVLRPDILPPESP